VERKSKVKMKLPEQILLFLLCFSSAMAEEKPELVKVKAKIAV